MKLRYIVWFLIYGVIALKGMTMAEAQNTSMVEVEVSSQKVMIGEKAYYLHTIKKGQTLYSIARAYQCTVNEILQENPNLTEEIKVDQVIKIPVKEKKTEVTDRAKDVIHTVIQGQTLFSIARMYGVSVDDIKLANQLTSDTLRVSQQLVIPVNKKPEQPSLMAGFSGNRGQFITHRVQEGETLYSLARRYGTTVEKIIELNPDQRDGLKVGAELKIPSLDSTSQPAVVNCDSLKLQLNGKAITIALLLPLFVEKNDSKVNDEDENREELQVPARKEEEGFPPVVMNFLEFYQGVLLAIEDLKKEGLSIELNVFDTGRGLEKISTIFAQPAFQKSKLIIGPVFSEQIPLIADYARRNHIPVILPVTAADSLVQQTYGMFQIFSGQKGEIEQLINALSPDTIRNILVIYNGKDNQDFNQQIKSALSPLFKNNLKTVREFYIYNYDFKDLLAQLDSTTMNHVVCFSSDEIFVASLLGQLEKKLLYYPIHTYGMSQWLAFNSVDLNYFYNQQLTCFSNFYVDYEQERVLRFLKKYRLRFGTEPIRNSKFGFNYCMLGYDLMRYFASAVSCLGNDFSAYNCITYHPVNVKMKFSTSLSTGGYVNRAYYRLQYNRNFTFWVE